MQLATFTLTDEDPATARIGVVIDDSIVDLHIAERHFGEHDRNRIPPDMIALLGAPRETRALAGELARQAQTDASLRIQLSDCRLLAPVPRPNTIRDCATYIKHAKSGISNLGVSSADSDVWQRLPAYYKGNPMSVIGTGQDVLWPSFSQQIDFELELGIFIGRAGKNISLDDAPSYIAGYTLFNDVSARDQQGEEMKLTLGPTKGKDFDTGNPIGPWIVAGALLDERSLAYTISVNGEEWTRGTMANQYWTFAELIAYVSRDETLHPGDFIAAGCVDGGCGLDLGRFPEPGDEISFTVEGIGTLTNRFVKP